MAYEEPSKNFGMVVGLILAGIAVAVFLAVLAWSPWTDDSGSFSPGQGGEDLPFSGTPAPFSTVMPGEQTTPVVPFPPTAP
jgi:hypothetical protein